MNGTNGAGIDAVVNSLAANIKTTITTNIKNRVGVHERVWRMLGDLSGYEPVADDADSSIKLTKIHYDLAEFIRKAFTEKYARVAQALKDEKSYRQATRQSYFQGEIQRAISYVKAAFYEYKSAIAFDRVGNKAMFSNFYLARLCEQFKVDERGEFDENWMDKDTSVWNKKAVLFYVVALKKALDFIEFFDKGDKLYTGAESIIKAIQKQKPAIYNAVVAQRQGNHQL